MSRLGDYVVIIAVVLNFSALCLYAYEQHWPQVLYWSSAMCLNLSLLWMR